METLNKILSTGVYEAPKQTTNKKTQKRRPDIKQELKEVLDIYKPQAKLNLAQSLSKASIKEAQCKIDDQYRPTFKGEMSTCATDLLDNIGSTIHRKKIKPVPELRKANINKFLGANND